MLLTPNPFPFGSHGNHIKPIRGMLVFIFDPPTIHATYSNENDDDAGNEKDGIEIFL